MKTEAKTEAQHIKPGRRRLRIILACAAVLALLVSGVIVYGVAIERYHVVVEQVRVPIRGLPAGLQGLRIALLADLHMTELGRREQLAAALTRELQPDLIAVSGDMLQHTVLIDVQERWSRQAGDWFRSLGRPPLGIWLSRGNSDLSRYGDFNIVFSREVEAAGVHLLANRAVSLTVGSDTLWLAGADFSNFDSDFVRDFRIVHDAQGAHVETGASKGESTLTYWAGEALQWRDYEVTGRFMRQSPTGAIGVTFYSRFPDGYYRYYYLRSYKGKKTLHIAEHGGEITRGRTDSKIEPQAGRWYNFRIRVADEAQGTHIWARIWPADEAEPAAWQIECLDEEPGRIAGGTVGLWGLDEGVKSFADLRVQPLDGGPALLETRFEREPAGQRPAGWLAWGVTDGNVRQALSVVPAGAATILLAHSPDQALEAVGTPAQLVLSGHTHGGQVRLPVIGALYTGTELGRRYSAGLYQLDGLWLYVTRGIGTRMFPIRLLCPPEVTLLTLERAP